MLIMPSELNDLKDVLSDFLRDVRYDMNNVYWSRITEIITKNTKYTSITDLLQTNNPIIKWRNHNEYGTMRKMLKDLGYN